MAITLLSLLMEQTEVTLTTIGAIPRLNQGDWGTKQRVEPIDIAGYSLMAAGLIGGLYKLFTA